MDGREQRLTDWMNTWGDAVFRTCFVYLGDRHQAEDAVQDTFLKAWHSMERFEGRNGCSEKTWLMRIAMNVCRDYRRSRWFRHIDARKALEDLPPVQEWFNEEDHLLLCEILRLPPKYKQVILLYYYQEMTIAEAAQALQTKPSTVHYRLKRAQTLLKRTLTGGESDG